MTFSIIGTGNIAWFLGKRLSSSGHQCRGVYGRDEANVKALGDALLSGCRGTIADVVDDNADVCFIAISDTAIPEVAAQLKLQHTILVHTSGAADIHVLQAGAKDYGVLWPVYSILKNNIPTHRDIPCAWEASSPRAKRFLIEMGHAITDNLFEAKAEQRKWLHLAAVFSNNFINHMLAINEVLCKQNDLPADTLQPLIKQTYDKVKQTSPLLVQTGPAFRHDDVTINRHIEMLATHPNLLKVYEAITESIQELHKK